VSDVQGEPLPGVNIRVQGTTTGTTTDVSGKYSIAAPGEQSVLQFSFIGFTQQDVVVGNQRVVNITLEEDALEIDEVVVVGYGTVRKSDITGAVSHIGSDDIRQRPVQNALEAMQGKMTGVDITTNARPGTLGDIRIRGNRSLNASNEPLYVIDGIPMGSGVGTGPNTAAIREHEYSLAAGSMADINPADIESIDILKDASATAIYGSRGANGVVLITTKKGRDGRTTVSYDGVTTFTRVKNLTQWMTAGEQLDWNRSAHVNASNYGGRYGTAPDPARDLALYMNNDNRLIPALAMAYELTGNDVNKPVLRDATPDEIARGYAAQVPVYNSANVFDNEWTQYVTRVARTDNHQLSVSGGTEKVKFYSSAAYLNQESVNLDQNFRRFTLNGSGEVQAKPWFKMGMTANLGYSVQDYGIINNLQNAGARDAYGQALNLNRWLPTFADVEGVNGVPVWVAGKEHKGEYALYTPLRTDPGGHNVLNNIDKAFNENRATSVIGSAYAEVKIMDGLRFRTNFGAQSRNQRNGRYYAPGWSNPQNVTDSNIGWGYYGSTANLSWTLENLLYYDKVFGDHSISATLLQSAEQFRTEMVWMRLTELTYESAKWYNAGANTYGKPHSSTTNFSQISIASYMARFNYSFKDRYLLTLTGRYDGSSTLAKGNKWDFFPSMSFAWKMEEEDFMKNQQLFSQMKLRAGYGVTGNAAVNAYQTGGTIYGQNYLFASSEVNGAKAQVVPTPLIGWEKTGQLNIGLDFGIQRNRFMGTIEYYVANTSDLLMKKAVPYATGYNEVWSNLGKTRNTGIEITLNTTNISTSDFSWRTNWSFSRNKEQVIETQYGKIDDAGQNMRIGHPMNPYFNYAYDRIWQNTDEDLRLIGMYKAIGGYTYLPGQAMVKDQPLVEGAAGTEGYATKAFTWTDANGVSHSESVTYLNNGFGTINTDDQSVLGSLRPSWVGGITNTLTYKDWTLSFYIYARIGAMYNTYLQTYGRRYIDPSDLWSVDNPGGEYHQARDGGISYTNYTSGNNLSYGFQKASFVAVRNIALSYQLPQTLLSRWNISSAQVYAQVLNPFLWGGKLVKAGINPDDDGKGLGANSQSNNTALYQSVVVGFRFTL
jgi:TonB-linked SusC/RagA family outer membrane protein